MRVWWRSPRSCGSRKRKLPLKKRRSSLHMSPPRKCPVARLLALSPRRDQLSKTTLAKGFPGLLRLSFDRWRKLTLRIRQEGQPLPLILRPNGLRGLQKGRSILLPLVQVPVKGRALEVSRDSSRTFFARGVVLLKTRDLDTCPLLLSGLHDGSRSIGQCKSLFGKMLPCGLHDGSRPIGQCKALSEMLLSGLLDGRRPIGQCKSLFSETL